MNDKRIAETKLNPGDRLTIGPVTFVVRINGEPAEIKPQDVAPKLEAADEPVVPVQTDGVDTNDILDLGDIDFDFNDPTSAIEAMLDEEDEQEKEK